MCVSGHIHEIHCHSLHGHDFIGDDYTFIGPLNIDFTVGVMGALQRIILISDDNLVEGDESFFVEVSSQNDRVMIVGSPASVTIVDNDGMST